MKVAVQPVIRGIHSTDVGARLWRGRASGQELEVQDVDPVDQSIDVAGIIPIRGVEAGLFLHTIELEIS